MPGPGLDDVPGAGVGVFPGEGDALVPGLGELPGDPVGAGLPVGPLGKPPPPTVGGSAPPGAPPPLLPHAASVANAEKSMNADNKRFGRMTSTIPLRRKA